MNSSVAIENHESRGGCPSPPLPATAIRTLAPVSLRVNVSWMLIGRAIYHGCQFVLLAVVARLASPEVAGQYILGLAVTAPIMMLASLQLHVAQCTDQRDQFSFAEYFALRVLCVALASGVATTVAFFFPSATLIIIAMAIAKSTESISDIYCGRLQKHENVRSVAVSLILRGAFSTVVASSIFAATRQLHLSVLATVFVFAGVVWLHDLPANRAHGLHSSVLRAARCVSIKRLGELAWLTIPLGVAYGLAALEINAPRYVVHGCLGEYELGVLGVMVCITMMGQLATAAIAQSAIPRIARLNAEQDHNGTRRVILGMALGGLVAGLATVLFAAIAGRPFLHCAFGAEYAAHQRLFIAVSVAATFAFISAMMSSALRALQYFRTACLLHFLGLVTVVSACLAFVPMYGLAGIAAAMVISSILTSALFMSVLVYLARMK